MLRTYSAVIADASCFIFLDKINDLFHLQSLFKTITTSLEIAKEFGKSLPEWVQIKTVQDKNFQSALFLQVDAGKPALTLLPPVKTIFDKIQTANFRIAASLSEKILKEAGE
jgi:predicted nucleic acid-binding protein